MRWRGSSAVSRSSVCSWAVWYSLGLTLIGLDYGFLIGVVAGVLSFVPYVGSLTALVLSLSVALFQGWPSLKLFLLALGVVGTGQFLEGNVLSPQLVGELIGLHPVWLMFALLAFGQLFGFLGLLIAVPTAAAIGVVARHVIAMYLDESVLSGPLGTGKPMISPPRQLTFRWPHSPSFAREDFLPAPSNLEALKAIELWPNWAGRMLMLVGPEGQEKATSGRSGRAPPAPSVSLRRGWTNKASRPAPDAHAVLIEDADCATRAEALFFHLINTAMQNNAWLMLTCRSPPDAWGIGTPDLLSRLRLAPVVGLAAPDIELTEAVLFKLFSDRQLQVEPHVIAYIALRIERSLGAARELVAMLDNEALTQGRRITRTMASDALREIASKGESP